MNEEKDPEILAVEQAAEERAKFIRERMLRQAQERTDTDPIDLE